MVNLVRAEFYWTSRSLFELVAKLTPKIGSGIFPEHAQFLKQSLIEKILCML
jgi:hypothetical protein